MSKKDENKIPLLSFYSGGGFLDMGFEMAGFQNIWTNEFDKDFAELHSAGITSWRKSIGNGLKAEIFNTKSILDITSSNIVAEAFPEGKPDNFGIIGGPPCQDFSINGKGDGFDGTRGRLTVVFFDKILELNPTFFVMENVTGLIKRKATKAYLKKLLSRIEKEYHVDYQTLNALDFGVPQFRERVFFVGVRKNKINKEIIEQSPFGKWFPFPKSANSMDTVTKYKWPIAVPFGKKLKKPKDLPIELCVENCLVPQRKIRKTPNADEYFNLYVQESRLLAIKEGETNRPSFKRLHRFKYSPTACYGNNEVHLHPYRNRRLSVRETLRIQGVPDTYVLPSEIALSKKFKMIGNGVPVPFAKAVATAMKTFLKENSVIK